MKLVVVPKVDVESRYAVSERIDDMVFVPSIFEVGVESVAAESVAVTGPTETTLLVVDDEAAMKLAETALVIVVTVVVEVVP